MDDFRSVLRDFKNVFTLKRLVTLLIVFFALLIVCAPQQPTPEGGEACDGSCPFPRQPPVINVTPVVITTVARENWSFDLVGEDDDWISDQPSNPDIKVVFYNESKGYMVLLIKEKAELSLQEYVVESIKGFLIGGGRIRAVSQVKLNEQKFVLLEGNVAADEVFYSWNSIKDGFGYSFCCFYTIDVDAGKTQQDTCRSIAESLEIK